MNAAVSTKDILIADDDKEDVEIFKITLEEIQVPHTIRHAENGDALFVLLKERIPHILFLDIHMPCKDGMACIAEIRKDRKYDRLPVIMYSSYSWSKLVEDAYKNGANFYLAKPHNFQQFAENLKKLFSIDWDTHMEHQKQDGFLLQ